MGIIITGTLGVLLSAYEEKILTAETVVECLDIMRNSGRRISDSLYQELLARLES